MFWEDSLSSHTVLVSVPCRLVWCTSESQPCSHGSLWHSYPWRCPWYWSTSLQEDTTAAAGSSCIWAIRPLPHPKLASSHQLLPWWRLHLQPCWSPTALLTANWKTHVQNSSMRLYHLVLKTSHWNKADKKDREEKTPNGQGQAIGNQSWSHYFNLTNIPHLISTTLPAFCTPSSATSICQIMHSLLRPEYYGCKKAFSPSWLLLQSNK